MSMAVPITTTYGTQDTTEMDAAVGVREDLTSIISRIDPAEVPFYSNCSKVGMKQTNHEWQTQDLGAPAKTKQPEGYEAAFAAPTPTARLGNIAHLLARSWIVSGTLDVVDKAGRDRETVYQRTLKGLELRRDLEATLLSNDPKDTADPRGMAGLTSWMVNGFFGTGAGALAGDGDGVTAPVFELNATPANDALSFAIVDGVLESIYNDGGKPTWMMCTPNAKRQFSGLDSSTLPAQSRFTQTSNSQTTFIGGVSVYVSDYGDLTITCNRFQPGNSTLGGSWTVDPTASAAETLLIIDKRHVQVASLPGRSFMSEPLAKTGDAIKGHVLFEGTLRNTAPKAHGVVMMATA